MPAPTQNSYTPAADNVVLSAEDRLKTAKAIQLREREQERKTGHNNPEKFALGWIGIIASGTFLMPLVGINAISPDTGPLASLRNVVMSVLGGVLVFGVGHFSIRIGAERVAAGDRSILVLCLGGYIATALIVAPIAYFAMAQKIAVEIGFTDHGQNISANIEAANRVAIKSQTIKPIADEGYTEISGIESCERLRGCLTNKPYSGTGPAPVSDFLGRAANKFKRAVSIMEEAENSRDSLIRDLNKAGDRFNEVAADRTLNTADKRKTLIALDSAIRDKLAQLEQVSPSRVLQNLSDLRSSSLNNARSGEGMAKAEKLARIHALRLDKALAELHAEPKPLPPFPGPVVLPVSSAQRFCLTHCLICCLPSSSNAAAFSVSFFASDITVA